MLFRISTLALLAVLSVGGAPYAAAQWPTEDQLQRLPATQQPPLPRIAQGGIIEATEIPTPEALVAPEMLAPEMEPESSASWFYPTYWFNAVDWTGGVEVGISGTDGNSESASFRAGLKLKRKTEFDETKFNVTYLKATADGVQTQHNAIQNLGYERKFGDSRWSWFAKEFTEYDEFKAFDLRIALNGGLGYKFIDTDITKLKGRVGSGVSHEIGGPNDDWVAELVYGADFERKLTERQKLSLTVDYFPEWGNVSNYRMVTDFGWEVLLDEEHNLNLKLSINDRYDSTPNGRKPNDINYALLLLWKL